MNRETYRPEHGSQTPLFNQGTKLMPKGMQRNTLYPAEKSSCIKGFRQECLLASFYLTCILTMSPKSLHLTDMHMSKVKNKHDMHMSKVKNILLYTDDMVLMPYTLVGIRRLLHRFSSYCAFNYLNINMSRTKIVFFPGRGGV